MKKHRIVGAMLVAGTIMLTLISALADEHPDCEIYAYPPTESSSVGVFGEGCREGCVQDRTITVVLRRDVSGGFDETLGEETQSGIVNGCVTAYWQDCHFPESALAFTEIRTSAGGKAQSDRAVVHCSNP